MLENFFVTASWKMCLAEPNTAKYKCFAAFTLHAFHPKALNDC